MKTTVFSKINFVLAALIFLDVGVNAGSAKATCSILFKDVNIVSMTARGLMEHQDLVISESTISSITPTSSGPRQDCKQVIEGNGQYLSPGLVNAHIHLNDQQELVKYLEKGITSVRTMNGTPEILQLRDRVLNGDVVGPTIVVASPITSEKFNSGWRLVATVDEISAALEEYKAAGYDLVKFYELSEENYTALAKKAKALGLPIAGHYPIRDEVFRDHDQLMKVLNSGARSLEHIEEVAQILALNADADGQIDLYLDEIRARNIVLTTILNRLIKRYPDYDYQPAFTFLKKSVEAGVFVALGTDSSGVSSLGIFPGITIHRELALLKQAGLTSHQVLTIATIGGARALGDDNVGVVAEGKTADLLLLRENPLVNLSTLESPIVIVHRGRVAKFED